MRPTDNLCLSYRDIEAIILGSQAIYIDKRLVIYSLENAMASAFWSEGTAWCTAVPKWFRDYRERGGLYLFRIAEGDRRYLLSVATCEFRNARHRRLNLSAFVERYPKTEMTIRRLLAGHPQAQLHFKLGNSRPGVINSLEM